MPVIIDPTGGGYNGWSPILAAVEDLTDPDNPRVVQQVADWVGGTGVKPAAGLYIGPNGFVTTVSSAQNIKGQKGESGGGGGGGGDAITLNGQPGSYYRQRANHLGTQLPDTIVQDSNHNFVTDTEKQTWNAKQPALGFTPENPTNKNQINGYAGLNGAGKILPGIVATDANAQFVTAAEKLIWDAKQNALAYTPENVAAKNQINGYAGLDGTGKIDPSALPALAINSVVVVANQAARLALNAKVGDAAKQTDNGSTYMLSVLPATVNANWIEIGDISPSWGLIEGKPTVFPAILGTGPTDAAAGNDARLSDARNPLAHTHPTSQVVGLDAFIASAATKTGAETLTNKTLGSPIVSVGSDATGDMYIRQANGTLKRIPIGTDGQILKIVSGNPVWQNQSAVTLVIDAGNDQTITLPTSTVQLAASLIAGSANTWTWTRTSGPANYGINAEAAAFVPTRTFTLFPDSQGRLLINGAGYTGGDLIQLSGVFKSVNVQNMIGTSPTSRIHFSNVPGQILKIGDTTWTTGQSYAEALNFTPNCKYITCWGRQVDQFVVEGPTSTGRESYKNVQASEYTDNIRFSYMTVKNGGTGFDIKKIVVAPGDPNSWGSARTLDNIQIDNCIVEDTWNEGMYLGNTFTWYNIQTGLPATPPPGPVDPLIYQKPIALVNLKVFNNDVRRTGADGIQMARVNGLLAYRNRVENPGTRGDSSHSAGMIVGGWVTDWYVHHCIIKNSGGDAFQVFGAGGVAEDMLIDGAFFNGLQVRMDTAAVTTFRRMTVVNTTGYPLRVNGEKGGTTAMVLEASIFVKSGTKIYTENGGGVTEGTGLNSNTKVDQIQDAQLDPLNYYLPATDPRGFRYSNYIGLDGGAGAVIVTPNAQSTLVNGLLEGTHVFEVTATNTDGGVDSDSVQVVVQAPVQNAPVANAGIDQSIELPTNSVTLNGSGSTAPGSSITGYLWEKISGPSTYTITTPAAVTTTVTGLVEGVYVFRLTVTNAESLTNNDTTQITVSAEAPPAPRSWTAVQGWANSMSAPNQYAMVYLCPNYDPLRVQKYPLFIDLHGQGEIGTGTGASGIDKVKTAGAGLMLESGDTPLELINVVPQLPSSPGTWEPNWVEAVRLWAIATYNVDPTKVYIGGYSLGNTGACKATLATPDKYAAVYGASGDTQYIYGSNASVTVNGVRVADVPYRHVVGITDTGATNGYKVLDTQGGLVTPPRYSALVEVWWGLGHVAGVWDGKLYSRKNRTDTTGTAPFDRYEWCLRFRANDPEFGATSHVAIAETSNDIRDYLQALKFVNDLASSSTKTALLGRLAAVLTIIKTNRKIHFVDLGTGAVVTGWNKASFVTIPSTLSNILDIDGNATTIDFAVINQQWTPPNRSVDFQLSWYGIDKNVLNDGFRIYNTANLWRWTGLSNAATYDLYVLYAIEKAQAQNTVQNSGAIITINGTPTSLIDGSCNTTKFPKIAGIVPTGGQFDMAIQSLQTNWNTEIMGFILIENLP